MSPEFGSTCAIFPIDAETLRYLAFSGRPRELIDLVEAYAKEQGIWHDETPRSRRSRTRSSSTSARSCRPSPARSARRTASRSTRRRSSSARRCRSTLPDGADAPDEQPSNEEDQGSSLSFPASDPPSSTEPVNGEGGRDGGAQPARTHDHSAVADRPSPPSR